MVAEPIFRLTPHRKAPRKAPDGSAAGACPDKWCALMAAAQDGHGGAYQRLLTDLTVWLKKYFERRLPGGDVDDAVQETLMAVHRRRHTYDPRQPFKPWLAAIARNKWIDQLRNMGRRPSDPLHDEMAVEDHEAAVTSASVLAGLLDGLRPAQALAIMRVKVHGHTIEDVSRDTGLSTSAVKMNIHRGLSRLTAFLEKSDDVD